MLVTARSCSVHDADFHADLVVDFIRQNNASGVDLGIGVCVWNELYVQAMLSRVRALAFKGRIILGGSQVSYTKSGLEDYYPNANVFIRGYGEETLAALMTGPPQIWWTLRIGEFDLARRSVTLGINFGHYASIHTRVSSVRRQSCSC